MAIYDDIANVIGSGGFDLTDLLHRIDVIYVSGQLTEQERTDLYQLARSAADPDDSLAPLTQRVEKLEASVANLAKRVQDLEDGTTTPGSAEKPSTEDYPEYVAPTGAHDAYWKDDRVTFNGKRYVCVAPDGVAVVWDPLTYPDYWQYVEDAPSDDEES